MKFARLSKVFEGSEHRKLKVPNKGGGGCLEVETRIMCQVMYREHIAKKVERSSIAEEKGGQKGMDSVCTMDYGCSELNKIGRRRNRHAQETPKKHIRPKDHNTWLAPTLPLRNPHGIKCCRIYKQYW